MSDRTIVLWMIAAFAWATPVAAQPAAPTTTAFDGTYVGVSRALEGTMLNNSTRWPPLAQPGPLTIVGGAARTALGNTSYVGGGTAEGVVTPQGVLVLRTPFGERIGARIDGRGTVTGRRVCEPSVPQLQRSIVHLLQSRP